MLAFALRRAIWAIPTLFGVSLVVFLLTTLLPDPEATVMPGDVEGRIHVDELRRARFLDLPRFLNVTPRDVRSRVDECVAHIVMKDDDDALCQRRLAEIGGAGLPWLLPHFDDIPPAERGRIALALAPVARRMGVGDEKELSDPDKAALFWERFWEDRSVDFTEPAVHRAVQRFADRDDELIEEEIEKVDTYALKELMAEMKVVRGDPEALTRLTRVASHVTGRHVVAEPNADAKARRAIVSDWQSWWYVHETDYVWLAGGEKITASIAQTRYAKWVLGAVTGQLGLSTRDGAPVFDKLLARAPVTLGMALLALFVALAIAVPVGVVQAWRQGQSVDHVTSFLLLAIYSVPTFLFAQLFASFGGNVGDFVLPVLTLATVSVSVMTQQQRASMIEALAQDYVRAARAKGARTLRVAIVHALRNALVPTVTLAGVQFPALVGAAFVVEEVFDVRGIGWETLRAIESRDVAWIVAVTLLCAVVTTACLVASDVAYGVLDPRVLERQTTRRRA
jgi:ABC-type dipeptide/oligopeptide/nickel transport system permease component